MLSSSDAAPRELLGKASYLDPSSVIPEGLSRKIGGRIKHSEQNTVPPEVTERQGTSTALWPRFNTSPRDTRGKVPHFDLSTAAPRGTSDIQR